MPAGDTSPLSLSTPRHTQWESRTEDFCMAPFHSPLHYLSDTKEGKEQRDCGSPDIFVIKCLALRMKGLDITELD